MLASCKALCTVLCGCAVDFFVCNLWSLTKLFYNFHPSLCVAGVALTEISEVHRKVHQELEENVSAEERRLLSYVTKFFDNCIASPTIPAKHYRCENVGPPSIHQASRSLLTCIRFTL